MPKLSPLLTEKMFIPIAVKRVRLCFPLKAQRYFLHSTSVRWSDRAPIPRSRAPVSTTKFSEVLRACSYPVHTLETLPENERFEEEELPGYKAEQYYPVNIGDICSSRYRVLAKLGFGTGSTTWLCRDLEKDNLLTLKVGIAKGEPDTEDTELAVSRHLKSIYPGEHPGLERLRVAVGDFQISSAHGTHQCLLFNPLGRTLGKLRNLLPERQFDKFLLQQTLYCILVGVDFLYQAGVVHTDISPNNILLGTINGSNLSKIEEAELTHPSARKCLSDRTIYISQPTPMTYGAPVICDFGSARIGEKHSGDVMPGVYRAPEVIMGMEWDSKIDIWSIGVMMWDLFEGGRLFLAVKDGYLNDELHLAEMVSLMGPPPKAFLERSENCRRYWDAEGKWIAATPIPDQSLQTREKNLVGEDRKMLLAFVRRILRWLPEERASAPDLFTDDFIMQGFEPEQPDIEYGKSTA